MRALPALVIAWTVASLPAWAQSGPEVQAGPQDPSPTEPEPEPEVPFLSWDDDGTVAKLQDPNRLEWLPFPLVAGNTDMGILLGAQLFMAKFQTGYAPYRWRFHLQAAASIKEGPGGWMVPVHMDFLRVDLPGLLDGRMRLFLEVAFNQVNNSGWYGVGNATQARDPSEDPAAGPVVPRDRRRAMFQRTEPMARVRASFEVASHLHVLAGLRFLYVIPGIFGASVLERDAEDLLGTTAHPALQASAGVIWDSRDHEWAPKKGFLAEASVRFSPSLGTGMTFGGVFLDGRSYVDLAGDWLVLATRVMGDMLFGEVPFYEMTRAGSFEIVDFPGGRLGLPGIPEGRYAGRIKIGANLELRSMFLKFRLMGTPVRVGALVFADAGRVWADWKPDPERDGRGVGLKWGVGGGIRIQYGEAVMMRLDAAWSPDAASAGSPVAIYADACHLF